MIRPRFDGLPIWPGVVVGALVGAAVPLLGHWLGATIPQLPELLALIDDARDVEFTEEG